MATTWATINARLSIFLNDEDGNDFSLAQRVDGWNAAQRLLAAQHTPRSRIASLVLRADGRSAVLPEDFLAIAGIYDGDDSEWWQAAEYPTRASWRADDENLNLWWIWGDILYFERDVDSSDDLSLYYWSYWPEMEVETVNSVDAEVRGDIAIPRWAELPCCYLTAAYCLEPGAMQAADLRQWGMSDDSGNPLQNSRALQARENLWWWDELLRRVKPADFHGV